jgi:predicted nucleic acid-binding protein
MVCADTSFLLSLAGNDTNSAAAVAHAKTMAGPVAITALTRLEFENAIALLRFRRAMPEAEASAAMEAMATDEEAGRITELPCDWASVMAEALRLSRAHTEDEGHRLLDILHVAAALKTGAAEFLSFDKRQRELAVAEGPRVGP